MSENFPSQFDLPSNGDFHQLSDARFDLHLRLVSSVSAQGSNRIPEGGELPREEGVAEFLQFVYNLLLSFGCSLVVVVGIVERGEGIAVDKSVGEESFDEENVGTEGVVNDGEEDDLESGSGLEEWWIELIKF